jgi:hypothetical protein
MDAEIHFRVQNTLPHVPYLSPINPVQVPALYV